MICSEGSTTRLEARAIGPVAAMALSTTDASLRVHSVFVGTLNLELDGTAGFVSLMGPSGTGHPHAVALAGPVDFRAWRLLPGSRAFLREDALWLEGEHGRVMVDLGPAERTVVGPLPRMDRLGEAHRVCVARLVELQDRTGCDLRMDGLQQDLPVATGLGRSLRRAALDLGEAAQRCTGSRTDAIPGEAARPSLESAVAALLGLGAGLTPAGDDFLCGFMAAARVCRPGLVPALAAAAEAGLHRTGRISGFLVRCAAQGFWPGALVNLAEALVGDQVPEALAALGDLGWLGHSSGLDLATGFLFGLETLLRES